MHFQLKPESEYTNQGYLYLMEKSEYLVNNVVFVVTNFIISIIISCRGLYSDMAKILLYLQEAKQTIYNASVQSANTWTYCEYLSFIIIVTA
jgi:hypothetical protein